MDKRAEIRRLAKLLGVFVSSTLKVKRGETLVYNAEDIDDLFQFLRGMEKANRSSDYVFKTQPYQHQREIFEASKDVPNHALFMEMGTGKTKTTIDTASYLFESKKIDTMVVIAPNGVHRNWINEINVHCPDRIPKIKAFWDSKKKAYLDEFWIAVRKNPEHFLIFTINIEAVNTKLGFETLQILMQRDVLLVVDESTKIKNHKAKRTKKILELSKQVKYRRILTGTPITQSPLDLYSQFEFLDASILGHKSFYTFQNRYCEQNNGALRRSLCAMLGTEKGSKLYNMRREKYISANDIRKIVGNSDPRVTQILSMVHKTPMFVTGYKNSEELHNKIKPFSSRVLKKDCLDLPEKIYIEELVDMTQEQKRIYKDMEKNFRAEIEANVEMSVSNILNLGMRLQQITGGFAKNDFSESYTFIGSHKIDRLKEIIEDTDAKIIVWSRFVNEIETLSKELTEYNPVLYYGGKTSDEKAEAIELFTKDSKHRIFIGNQASGGTGINLVEASVVVYYSNTFSLEDRLQSEDRAHRIGQKNNVTYIDLVCKDSIDTKVKKALLSKKSISDEIVEDRTFLF